MTAKRFGSTEAVACGLVDTVYGPDVLFDKCLELAEKLNKFGVNKSNFKKLKEEMNKNAIDCCFNKGHAVGVRAEV